MPVAHITEALEELLSGKVSVDNQPDRGTRQKAISILRQIWCVEDDECHLLRTRGLRLLSQSPKGKRIVYHWGMIIAAYPFVAVVAEQVGRLLQLQATVGAAQVQRRLRERYGERETVARAARRILRSFIDWGALDETDSKGLYRAGRQVRIDDSQSAAWLIEAFVHSHQNGRCTLSEALSTRVLFPFEMPPLSCESLLQHAPGLDAVHRGIESDVVALRV